MKETEFIIEDGPETDFLRKLKKELNEEENRNKKKGIEKQSTGKKKEVEFEFCNEDSNCELVVNVKKITEHKQMFHIYGTVTEGHFEGFKFHAQYSSRDKKGLVWIWV